MYQGTQLCKICGSPLPVCEQFGCASMEAPTAYSVPRPPLSPVSSSLGYSLPPAAEIEMRQLGAPAAADPSPAVAPVMPAFPSVVAPPSGPPVAFSRAEADKPPYFVVTQPGPFAAPPRAEPSLRNNPFAAQLKRIRDFEKYQKLDIGVLSKFWMDQEQQRELVQAMPPYARLHFSNDAWEQQSRFVQALPPNTGLSFSFSFLGNDLITQFVQSMPPETHLCFEGNWANFGWSAAKLVKSLPPRVHLSISAAWSLQDLLPVLQAMNPDTCLLIEDNWALDNMRKLIELVNLVRGKMPYLTIHQGTSFNIFLTIRQVAYQAPPFLTIKYFKDPMTGKSIFDIPNNKRHYVY